MAYVAPTLWGVAYAARLFRETGYQSTYDNLLRETNPRLNLMNAHHVSVLVKWLNKWGCRIGKDNAAAIRSAIRASPRLDLPPLRTEVTDLGDTTFARLEKAYQALRDCGLGPTASAKTLFALRPKCAIPWDTKIRREFSLRGDSDSYGEMLRRSQQEARQLVENAKQYGVVDLPAVVGSSQSSLAKLLDEYHWVTITARHRLPAFSELNQWVSWCREAGV